MKELCPCFFFVLGIRFNCWAVTVPLFFSSFSSLGSTCDVLFAHGPIRDDRREEDSPGWSSLFFQSGDEETLAILLLFFPPSLLAVLGERENKMDDSG